MAKTPEELTADWEEGKLPADDYFIKLINNDITTGFFDGLDFSCCADFGIFQILAPVPTYDEYKAMQERIADLSKKAEELELNNKILEKCQEEDFGVSYVETVKTQRTNKELRGLLRECEAWMSWAYAELYEYDPEHESKNTEYLLTRINAVISESEV